MWTHVVRLTPLLSVRSPWTHAEQQQPATINRKTPAACRPGHGARTPVVPPQPRSAMHAFCTLLHAHHNRETGQHANGSSLHTEYLHSGPPSRQSAPTLLHSGTVMVKHSTPRLAGSSCKHTTGRQVRGQALVCGSTRTTRYTPHTHAPGTCLLCSQTRESKDLRGNATILLMC